jgi:hypothetical protein
LNLLFISGSDIRLRYDWNSILCWVELSSNKSSNYFLVSSSDSLVSSGMFWVVRVAAVDRWCSSLLECNWVSRLVLIHGCCDCPTFFFLISGSGFLLL